MNISQARPRKNVFVYDYTRLLATWLRIALVCISMVRIREDEIVNDDIRTLATEIETCNSEYLGGSNILFTISACLRYPFS